MRLMTFGDKIMCRVALLHWRESLQAAGRRLVVTNGCFDVLHLGHVTYLEAARNLGDALLVGVNGDASVRKIKGEGRPINPEADRAAVLAALASVDAVFVFSEPDAMEFLRMVRPDVYAKGGDYTIETINQPERRLVEQMGGRVVVLAGVAGRSTTAVIERLKTEGGGSS